MTRMNLSRHRPLITPSTDGGLKAVSTWACCLSLLTWATRPWRQVLKTIVQIPFGKIVFVAVTSLLCSAGNTVAAFPATQETVGGWDCTNYLCSAAGLPQPDSPAAAVAQCSTYFGSVCYIDVSPDGITWVRTAGQGYWYGAKLRIAYSCPANSTLNSSSCTCNAFFVEAGAHTTPRARMTCITSLSQFSE
jgi:hypothetical protein